MARNTKIAAQHALAPDAAPLRCAAQVKRRPLARPLQKKIIVKSDVETGKISGGQKE
jgi:hypothetical protein